MSACLNHCRSAAAVGSGQIPRKSSASALLSDAELLVSTESLGPASGSPAGSGSVAGLVRLRRVGDGRIESRLIRRPRCLLMQSLEVFPRPGIHRE